MNIPDKHRAYGDIPERFDAVLVDALDQAQRAHRPRMPAGRRRITRAVVLVSAMFILLVGGILGRMNLLDVVEDHQFGEDAPHPSYMITDIAQTGGITKDVRFRIESAYYDGRVVQLFMSATPGTKAEILLYSPMDARTNPGDATLYGEEIRSVSIAPRIEGAKTTWLEERYVRAGATVLYMYKGRLPEDFSPETLAVQTECTISDMEQTMDEVTTVSFEIGRSAQVTTKTLAGLDIDVGRGIIREITMTYTPMEMDIIIGYDQITMRPPMFALVEKGGQVIADNGNYNIEKEENHFRRDYKHWMLSGDHQGIITLWMEYSKLALRIDPEQGTVTTHAVAVTGTERAAQIHFE